MYRESFAVVFLVVGLAQGASGALLSMEWASNPGDPEHTMVVGESATINIRLDIIAGESFGWAWAPVGMPRLWLFPPPTPHFEITDYAPNGFIGPGFTYNRSAVPLPFSPSPDDFRLITAWDQVTPIAGPATIYLDALEIEAIGQGEDRIAFGAEFVRMAGPEATLRGSDGNAWLYYPENAGLYPGYWDYGLGHPGSRVSPSAPTQLWPRNGQEVAEANPVIWWVPSTDPDDLSVDLNYVI